MYFLIFASLSVAFAFLAVIFTSVAEKIDAEYVGGKAFALSMAYFLTSFLSSLAAVGFYFTAVASIIRIKF